MYASPAEHNRLRVFNEGCNLLGITNNMSFRSPEGRNFVRGCIAQIAAIVMEDTQVPWLARGPPLGAGYTGAVSLDVGWQISKSLLLRWRVSDVVFMRTVYDALMEAMPDEEMTGCVGVPQYSCQGSKRFINRGGKFEEDDDNMKNHTDQANTVIMPCGSTAEMTAEGQNTGSPRAPWLCNNCKENNRTPIMGQASRIVSLYPLIRGKSESTLMTNHSVDLILYPPPKTWSWPHPRSHKNQSTPLPADQKDTYNRFVKVDGKSVLRVAFEDTDSDNIWKAASNYTPPSSQHCCMNQRNAK